MSLITVGRLIKINPEIFTEGVKDDELLGDLGYPALFRHLLFEVEKTETDAGRGEIVYCRATNAEVLKDLVPGVKSVKCEGTLVILLKDAVLANTKVTLDYTIKYSVPPKSKDEVLASLMAERDMLKGRGLKKDHESMKVNWRKIQICRGERTGVIPEMEVVGTAKVVVPKAKMEFTIPTKDLPGTDEDSISKFKQLLTNKIRGVRRERKIRVAEVKDVFGQRVEKQGGVYLKSKSLLTAYEEFMKTTLETDKKPIDPKATYVGIEIEFLYSGAYDKLKKLLIEKKLHKYVCLKQDGSVQACHNSGYRSLELTLICKRQEVEKVLAELDHIFVHPEIDAYVNRSCGLHVHLDMRHRDPSLVYKNLVRVQNLLRGAQPVGRVKNTHCRPNESDDFKESVTATAGGNARQVRYSVVNGLAYAKHSTIEIRIHEGSVDCEGIYNWTLFLDAIAEHNKEIPKNTLKFAEDLSARFDVEIPLSAIAYVDERIKKFSSLAV